MSTDSALRHRLDLPGPAVHLRRPGQHADPGPPGRAARHRRSRPSRSAPTSRCPTSGDIYLIGGGEDGPQALAAQRLIADGGLHRAVDRGAAVLAVCAGYQLIGTSFFAKGAEVRRPRPARPRSDRGETRAVGELAGDIDPRLGPADADRLREPRRPHPAGPGRRAAGPGHRRHRQRRRSTEGAWHGQDPRHLLARSRARPQPGAGRPAAALGDRRGQLPPLDDTWPDRLRAERLAAAGAGDRWHSHDRRQWGGTPA